MKLSDHIRVEGSYTRSINLERDFESEDLSLTKAYIATSRTIFSLERVSTALAEQRSPKAWALVGPYGSGKSAFGNFLTKVFGDPTSQITKLALGALRKSNPKVTNAIQKLTRGTKGVLPIVISGSPEALSKRLSLALLKTAEKLKEKSKGATPRFINDIKKATKQDLGIGSSDILNWTKELRAYAGKKGYSGIFIIIDELGKFLEYEARHRGAQDIFLLQALAEQTADSDTCTLSLVVLLHQAIEQYVASFGKQLRDEWKKVQGRFENIPYIESSEQVIRVLEAAIIRSTPTSITERIEKKIKNQADTLRKFGGLQHLKSDDDLTKLLSGCYPLHPVTTAALPLLCQKVAQNERTLFTYLSSKEPQGFQDLIGKLQLEKNSLPWIYPHHVYDYFISNHPGLLSDQITQRRWAEVTTAVERLGDAEPFEVDLLKTIGILNIAGAQSGIRASKGLLAAIFSDDLKKLDASLENLSSQSLITFRKFNNEFRVWQGSDFDLEVALSEQRQIVEKMNIAELLNERQVIRPIVARRNAIETGTLRYFPVRFYEFTQAITDLSKQKAQQIAFLLPQHEEQTDELITKLKENDKSNVLTAIVNQSTHLRDAIIETAAFGRLEQHYPQIANDPIALREIKDRFDISAQQERTLLADILRQPHLHQWFWRGQSISLQTKRDFQSRLSEILEEIFSQSPRLNNEIINRDKLSASGTSARRKLLAAMVENPDKENLNFEKFPPEKSIYLSIFQATGAHRKTELGWEFTIPHEGYDRLTTLWTTLDNLLEDSREPVAIESIQQLITAPPFGIKEGVQPLLLIAYYQSRKNELALFENGHFSPFLTFEIVEKIIKKPKDFSLQRFAQNQTHLSILESYHDLLDDGFDSGAENCEAAKQPTLIDSARKLAKFMAGLPDYAKNTLGISKKAAKFRESFFAAKSPYRLMFIDIPEIFDLKPFAIRTVSEDELKQFRVDLSNVISELRSAHHVLINANIKREICDAFGEPHDLPLDDLKTRLTSNRYRDLQNYTIDTKGLKAFLGRVCDEHGDGRFWIENIANFLARKPSEKWIDEDWDTAKFRLTEFTAKIRDIEKLRALKPRKTKSNFDDDTRVILIRTLSEGAESEDKIAILNNNRIQKLGKLVQEIERKLEKLEDPELANAVLAMILGKEQLVKVEEAKPKSIKRRQKT